MRIGFLVDGQSEYQGLPQLLNNCVSPHDLIKGVLLAHVHPEGPAPTVANQLMKKVPVLRTKNINRLIVLLDHETSQKCPGDRAEEIESNLNRRILSAGLGFDAKVVMKFRCLENWLLADVETLKSFGDTFDVSNAPVNLITPNKVDNIPNPIQLIKRCCRSVHSYDKISHSKLILSKANPEKIAENSRSFRRFLHLIDHPLYSTQSRIPR